MKSVVVLLSVWMSLSTGYTVSPNYKGCFATSFVQQYAFYYKFHQSLSLEQCTAICNSRLTRYMGLETDESSPDYNYVFCGNDLAEVSPKTYNNQCNPCHDNSSFFCGRNGTMSVYLLRDSTPLSLLLATGRGVELLSDNMTRLKVSHPSSANYNTLDYMYTEDMIVSAISTSLLRSFYNPLTMNFSQHYEFFNQQFALFSSAVDFLTRHIYYCYNGVIYIGSTLGTYVESMFVPISSFNRKQISIDPYNRSLVFLEYPYDTIYVVLWDRSLHKFPLTHQHVKEILALSMDIHEILLYAILTFTGDSTTYLVSLDYGVSQMRIVSSGPHLENATLLEVFRHDAVWITTKNGMSTVFQCKLMPKCLLDTLIVLPINQTIYDFTIYHPEKQTPGRKRLCANMTCSHGCQLFSPFTAICTCPPGMDLKPDHSSCFWEPTRVQTVPTTSISSSHESSKSPVNSTTPIYGLRSAFQFITHKYENQTPGNRRLYDNMSCFQICQIISLFTCSCTCPPGIKLDSDNSTCVWEDSDDCTYVPKKKYHMKPNLKLNWYAAYMHCRSKGWSLATILNEHQNEDMLAYIRNTYPGDGKYAEGIWIGATELGQNGTWQWMSTGRPMEFTDWLQGKPNHQVGSEHCLDLWTLKWNNSNCGLNQPFVCEYIVHEPACV